MPSNLPIFDKVRTPDASSVTATVTTKSGSTTSHGSLVSGFHGSTQTLANTESRQLGLRGIGWFGNLTFASSVYLCNV